MDCGEPEFCVCVAKRGSVLVTADVSLCIGFSALTMVSSGAASVFLYFCTLGFGSTVKETQPKSQSQLPLRLSPIPLLWPCNPRETALSQGKGDASESHSAHASALLLTAALGWAS